MATGTIIPWIRQQFLDNSGNVVASGTVETYEAGTSTPLAAYTDAALTVAAPTTITLNSAGAPQVSGTEVTLYLLPRAYKFIIKNSAGSTIKTVDNVYAVQPAIAVNLETEGTAGEDLAANDLAYLSDGSGSRTAGRWYKADADVAYSSLSPQLAFVPSAIASGASGTLRSGGIMDGLSGLVAGTRYFVSGTAGAITATAPTNARSVGVAESATRLVLALNSTEVNAAPRYAQGRLTLTSGTSVTTSDVTAAGTLYYTPHIGNLISLYNGTRWVDYAFSEISLALVITSGVNYDVFLRDNAGTLTLDVTAWADDTTRLTAITLQNGAYVKSGDATRRYLGTLRSSGTNTCEDSRAKRFLWNYYNRRSRAMSVFETTNSWTYTTATWRQANGSTANQLAFVVGVAEEEVTATLAAAASNSSAGVIVGVAIGPGSVTSIGATAPYHLCAGCTTPAANAIIQIHAHYRAFPAIGYRILIWQEHSAATGTTTWYGDNGGGDSGPNTGIIGSIAG